jgi:hypothetical protein
MRQSAGMRRPHAVVAAGLAALASGCSLLDFDALTADRSTDGGAAPDAANVRCNAIDCERTVFVTSVAFSSDLGGLLGADAKCQAAADASTHPRVRGRTFRAWLSVRGTAAKERLLPGTGAYKRPDGAIVVPSFAALVAGDLTNPISHDENDAIVPTGDTWTGTLATGEPDEIYHCADWSAAGLYGGRYGDATKQDHGWTEYNVALCSQTGRLYCFEQ